MSPDASEDDPFTRRLLTQPNARLTAMDARNCELYK